jgi:glucose/mannose-6-phosphate isomerase
MMNLDDLEHIHRIDRGDMLAEINLLPQQLQDAWDLGHDQPLPDPEGIQHVIVAGMGGSAIGGDLLAAFAAPLARVPVIVWRDYGLPAFVNGPATLLIVSSHSGDTEETLSAFEAGIESGARVVALTTGGQLGARAEDEGAALWTFQHVGQPRAAVGYSFGMLLAALSRLGLIEGASRDIASAVQAMKSQQPSLVAETPVARNPAKRLAGQFVERHPLILGSGTLAPVARRWRTQIAELSKAMAQFEELPEADHNVVAGVVQPEGMIGGTMATFLRGSNQDPRNLKRIEVTRDILMVEGFNTDILHAQGGTRLAQQWTALHFGDYVAFYLAIAYNIDPTPVAAIENLKQRLKE